MLRRTSARLCPASSSSSSSPFLASLLANAGKPKPQPAAAPIGTASGDQQQAPRRKMSVPLIFDPQSLKLDVLPKGLSKKAAAATQTEDENPEAPLSLFKKSKSAASDCADDSIRFPAFDASADYDARQKRELQEQRRKQQQQRYAPFAGATAAGMSVEDSFAMLSISRRVGDWSEALRLAAAQWKPEPFEGALSASSTALLQQQIGMAAQAAWACARAVELQMVSESEQEQQQQSPQNDAEGEQLAASLGPIHGLNSITLHLIARFENRPVPGRDVDGPESAAPPLQEHQRRTSDDDELRRKSAFVRATAGNIVAVSEAMRACGGIDLVMALDGCVGRFLRRHWKDRGLLLETQRWNHEMLMVYNLVDDWKGALGFFMRHCGQRKQEEQAPAQPAGAADTATSAAASSAAPDFSFKKAEQAAATDPHGAVSAGSVTPSIVGATTIAVLIDLLTRNEKQELVSRMLSDKSLVRDAERAALARAFAALISSWSNQASTTRRMRDGGSSAVTSGGGGLSLPRFRTDDRS